MLLFTAGSFSYISNSPTYSLDRNIATEHSREEKVHLVPPLPGNRLTWNKASQNRYPGKKNLKSQVFTPFPSALFYIYIQSPEILADLPSNQYFGYTLLCSTQNLITDEQRVAAMLIVTVQCHPLPRLTTWALHRECKQKSFSYWFCSLIFPSLLELTVLGG